MSDPQGFIASVLPGAASVEMKTGLPGAVLIAQAIQETGWGQYVTKDKNTGQNSFNLFNIKGTGTAGKVLATTFEYYNGVRTTIDDYFRAYNNYEESFADYTTLITGNSIYAKAVAVKADPGAYAQALYDCGYATDPNYAKSLISLMNQYDLINKVEEEILLALIAQDSAGNLIKQGAIPEWSVQAVATALSEGFITQTHNANELVTIGAMLAIFQNILKKKGLV